MPNLVALNRILDELVDNVWGYALESEDRMPDVWRIRSLILALVAPDEQPMNPPGEFIDVGEPQDDWLVTGTPGEPTKTVVRTSPTVAHQSSGGVP